MVVIGSEKSHFSDKFKLKLVTTYQLRFIVIYHKTFPQFRTNYSLLGFKDLGFYVFRTLICIVGKPWSKQCV